MDRDWAKETYGDDPDHLVHHGIHFFLKYGFFLEKCGSKVGKCFDSPGLNKVIEYHQISGGNHS